MNRVKLQAYFTGIIITLFLLSCEQNPLIIDVSSSDVALEVKRLDEAVFSKNWTPYGENNTELKNEYGNYYLFYSEFILNNLFHNDSMMQRGMSRFASDPTMKLFYQEIDMQFGGEKFDPYFEEIQNAFKHFNYYFPEEEIPTLLLYQSGFNYKIVPNDTLLGVGLEWYIGSDNDLIKKLSPQAFPQFEKNKMKATYLVVDAIKGFLKVKYQEREQMDNLLSVMVFYGKILYLTDALLPEKEDALKMNYTNEEWAWMVENEKQIWTYIAENNLLFNNDLRLITQWVNDGPFTTGLPQESPSRAGIYIGWQMVKQYMDKYPKSSLKELLQLEDYNRILSAYKPKK